MRVEFYRNLYISEQFEKKKEKIMKKLLANKFQTDVYLLTLPHGEQNQLEFFHSMLLKQKVLQRESYFVVGIAAGYEEAVFLVEKITKEVYDETGTTDIKNYILGRA